MTASDRADRVSVVIPTRGRPEMVVRAVASALAQSLPVFEVIVVVDGPDPATANALAEIGDGRLRVLVIGTCVGGGEARNAGVRQATGEWIGFLDDDDEWLPEKLALQLAAAKSSSSRWPIICCQVIARSDAADCIWPDKPPRQPYSNYLLVRSRLGYGEGLIQTSTIIAPRELLARVGFAAGLPKYQDWDWVLRCTQVSGVEVVFVPKPLVIWALGDGRARTSHQDNWRASYAWIKSVRSIITPRAYASFIATYVAPQAADARQWQAFFPLLTDALFGGTPAVRDLCMFGGAWLVPARCRSFLKGFVRWRAGRYARHRSLGSPIPTVET
jgi:glycosyltransferase involved in cell wall biosynthesis